MQVVQGWPSIPLKPPVTPVRVIKFEDGQCVLFNSCFAAAGTTTKHRPYQQQLSDTRIGSNNIATWCILALTICGEERSI